MNKTVKNTLVLAAICSFFALLLGVVNAFTEPKIDAYNQMVKENGLKALMTSDETLGDESAVKDVEGVLTRYVLLTDDQPSGYILELSGYGFASALKILAAYDLNGVLLNSVLTEQAETKGDPTADWYMALFKGYGGENPFPQSKGDLPSAAADAISGASITFMAVSGILEKGSDYIKTQGAEQ